MIEVQTVSSLIVKRVFGHDVTVAKGNVTLGGEGRKRKAAFISSRRQLGDQRRRKNVTLLPIVFHMDGMRLCQARRDGIRLSKQEVTRLNQKIRKIKLQRQTAPPVEYSPKQFHRSGCYCTGGVSGRTTATVIETQTKPFTLPPHEVNFLVSSSGFVSPVPDNATGPYTPTGSGVKFIGGSGGHGLNHRVTEVLVMDPTDKHKHRTYYLNISRQKVDPFTGKTIDRSHPMAHIYHEE